MQDVAHLASVEQETYHLLISEEGHGLCTMRAEYQHYLSIFPNWEKMPFTLVNKKQVWTFSKGTFNRKLVGGGKDREGNNLQEYRFLI